MERVSVGGEQEAGSLEGQDEFVAIPGYSFHVISKAGVVKTLARTVRSGNQGGVRAIPERVVNPDWYGDRARFSLQEFGKVRKDFLARLLLLTFVGPPPPDKPFACHRNDNTRDNSLDNLYWGDQVDNMADRRRNHGRY